MNKYVKLVLMIIGMVVSGCGKDSSDEPNNPSNADYYVKYEASVSSPDWMHTEYLANITVNTDIGIQVFSARSFTQTFGPVKKGFKASIEYDPKWIVQPTTTVKISVSRGAEPFALKAVKTVEYGTPAYNISKGIVKAEYTIDY